MLPSCSKIIKAWNIFKKIDCELEYIFVIKKFSYCKPLLLVKVLNSDLQEFGLTNSYEGFVGKQRFSANTIEACRSLAIQIPMMDLLRNNYLVHVSVIRCHG